jgi:hypothetical protein
MSISVIALMKQMKPVDFLIVILSPSLDAFRRQEAAPSGFTAAIDRTGYARQAFASVALNPSTEFGRVDP